ncbi:F-box protein At4g35733-like [Rosa rugosa]|uniref:F-box protein At4g35733-like n=1 Tax=Rosa rugosa TaxID=74645 RepID=UPI002B4031D1|nr:F-box protein At4g35733-like [Rosa rugosa]
MSSLANWSDLPQDLAISIAKLMVCMEDFLSFGAVCKSWRSTATKENFTGGLKHQVPFLILPEKEGTANRELYNLTKGKCFELSGLEVKGQRLFSSLGWLLTESKDAKVLTLLHPLNHTQIKLPENFRYEFIKSFALSASPSLTSDFVVMVLYHYRRGLAFCKEKDNEWTRVDARKRGNNSYFDLTYYREQFYVLDLHGRVLVCDIEDPKKAKTRVVVPQIPRDTSFKDYPTRLYLVESAGTLLVVRVGYQDKTIGFRVFEVPFSNCDWSYSKVKNLGNRTLFLNVLGSSFSIEASNYSGVKSNCIYFRSILFSLDEEAGSGMCIFDTEDEKSDLRGVFINSSSFAMSYLWIQPSF